MKPSWQNSVLMNQIEQDDMQLLQQSMGEI
jgi:hypothetical protein